PGGSECGPAVAAESGSALDRLPARVTPRIEPASAPLAEGGRHQVEALAARTDLAEGGRFDFRVFPVAVAAQRLAGSVLRPAIYAMPALSGGGGNLILIDPLADDLPPLHRNFPERVGEAAARQRDLGGAERGGDGGSPGGAGDLVTLLLNDLQKIPSVSGLIADQPLNGQERPDERGLLQITDRDTRCQQIPAFRTLCHNLPLRLMTRIAADSAAPGLILQPADRVQGRARQGGNHGPKDHGPSQPRLRLVIESQHDQYRCRKYQQRAGGLQCRPPP